MPPVIALLPVIASVALAAFGVGAVISAIVVAVVTVASMVATKLLTKKPKGNRISQGAELQTKISPSLPRTVLVGQNAIGPSCHFAFTYTDDSSKPNRYLVRVLQISDQPCDSLVSVNDGQTALTFTGDVTTGWFACNQHVKKDGTPAMWLRVYKGVYSGAVADATLISISGGKWTSAHKGTGLCYAIVKYDYDSDAFPNGEPELVFEMKGARVYDDRLDSTVSGGSGPQRLADPTTWAFSNNTGLVIAQYLRGFFINGVRIVGVGAEARDLYAPMLFSAYNTCDQTVSTASGTEKRYTCGYNLRTDTTATDHLTDLAAAMDGEIFDRGGAITIWPGAVRTPVLNLGMQDIDWTAEKSWQPKASLDQMINCVQGNFVDATNYYQERDLPVRSNAQWELDDGGERFSTFLSLAAVTDWSQAQRVTNRVHQASRFNGIAAFVGGLWLMELEPGDWFTLTVPRWQNMTSKYFEVHEVTLTSDMRVALIGTEVATSLDDWAPASNEFARSDTYWNAPPYNLVVPTFTLSPYSFYDSLSGVQDFGFTFTLTSPVGDTSTYGEGVEIQYALTSNLGVTWSSGVMSLDQVNTTQTGLVPQTSYSVRARTTGGGRSSDWSSWVTVVTATANTAFMSALAGISLDNVLSIDEKSTLIAAYNDLEQRFNAVLSRATALGLSTTALTTAHNNWLNYLAAQSPPWNDTTQATTIYTGLFPDTNFPTGWTKTSSSTTASNPWTNVTDSSGTAQGRIARSVACSANTQYSAGVLIKKDAVGKATRNPVLTLVTSGGTAKTATLAIDSSTGITASNGATASGSTDMGDSWFVWFTFTTNTGNNNITFTIYPAGSQNLSTTLSGTPQGTVAFRGPVLAQGDITDLGSSAMVARETDLVIQIENLNESISQTDGATSVVIDPIDDVIIYADSTGVIKAGELPRQVGLTASIGLNPVTTLGTWSMTATTGITATIGAATGILNITADAVAEVSIPITFVYANVTRTGSVHVVIQSDPPTNSGGGGGGGGGGTPTQATTTALGATTGATYSSSAASAVLSLAAGASGSIALVAPITYKRNSSSNGTTAAAGKWQWRVVGGTFADVAAEQVDTTNYAETSAVPGDPVRNYAGSITVSQTKTGLTSNTTYEFQFLWREVPDSGAAAHIYRFGGTLTATAS